MQNKIRPHSVLSMSCFLLAISIVLGALAAHALKNSLDPVMFNTFQVGVHYHQLQSLGLLILGVFLYFKPEKFSQFRFPIFLHFFGLILFSGNCYLYALTQIKFFVHIVPVGGVMMILAWFWSAFCWTKN